MRAATLFVLGLALAASALGCYPCQHTAGVCDCDPPPVHYVLQPPPRPAYGSIGLYPGIPAYTPPAPAGGVPVTVTPEAVPAMPKAVDPK
jgi:hypothetical protein